MPDLLGFASQFKHAAIICHPNADPDCIGSAYALREYLMGGLEGIEVAIVAPEGINAATDKLLAYLSLKLEESLPPSADLLILVDLSSLDQIPSIKEKVVGGIPFAILDHHVPDSATLDRAAFAMVKQRASTCEIVLEAAGKAALSRTALNALMAGLIYDSRRFLNSPRSSIKSASSMMELGADPEKAMAILTGEEDPSERMAKLKGAARLRLYRADEYLIGVTNVGSFEASVARVITNLGADLAIVLSENGKEVRISGRSTESFYKSSGLNLARDVMQPLASTLGGHGGGHPTAASATAKCEAEDMISSALGLIAKKLGAQLKEVNTKK